MPDATDHLALALSALLSLAAASTGAIFRPDDWYRRLRKPSWTPPDAAFPVVWSVLYLAMAIAAWTVWRAGGAEAWPALAVYGLHLVLNALWSWVFFGLKRIDLALGELVIFWLSIVVTILLFWPFSRQAALLLLPYLGWVTAAGVLNWRILVLNGPRGVPAQSPTPVARGPAPWPGASRPAR